MTGHAPLVGVIGGSGLYKLEGIEPVESLNIDTPWGRPSSPITLFKLPSGPVVAFLARHGVSHQFTPSEVPSRANIAALKKIGCQVIIAFSAVGSLREEIKPRDIVVPSQIIDRTKSVRPCTFFEGLGVVGHAMFGEPFDTELTGLVTKSIKEAVTGFEMNDRIGVHAEKVAICMEGPAFSTRAESNMYRMFGGDIINMSVLPEAKLAREAELSYALIAQITDYDAWRESEEPVTVAEVMATIAANVSVSNRLTLTILDEVHNAVAKGQLKTCKGTMEYSVMTKKEMISEESKKTLSFILPYFS
ncbi:S-methyl-5-thioadenosine phosphorylase [Puccinia graminis f. sp. tritici]|uniref:S-methyl-5'-thioadenosine phosphorylase 1 n=2 Tax=Puccinia graminis f. sp. tritici TaxID=56615 RepID=MTAP1_PUCGT|nr:5'-methylthioadenosine phosphorylase [Puccinia graminis f. sp. tritici CRL 75-36-700-3]E3K7C3.1 RecName: Full=S-methyl-5'-thioadenosine phosphorylase 1; AltName: Full=5'-methylthioadenosine phosphorylase 1; Short=MTA phosphorylase 1; Short=MTAP 1; Short=MTAPase 1 [Puccinia graminis f. sp. tritici CRL 75-36-700-3]KAA1070206.1 S-methyl-5-thioadenosine phosphorylase [Puccinia graminis f. sp. tritici]EFP80453.1 5'-methylthioadenosine phosphorylase [Puccinia graminis f. sp. tritici CRL 75-36-700-3